MVEMLTGPATGTGSRAAFLAAAGRRVSGSLDFTRTQRLGLRVCVPEFADWAQLLLVDGGRATVLSQRAGDRILAATVTAPVTALTGQGRVLATGRTELLHVADGAGPEDTGLVALVPDLAMRRQVDELRPADILGVALNARGATFGSLTLARRSGLGFDPEDIELAEDLAAHLALALDAARRYSERAHVAAVLQASLRPPELPEIPGVRLAARYRSGAIEADIGGDFYDVWRSGDNWSVVLGDVSGKGVSAAVVTGQARHSVRGAAYLDPSPPAVLGALNALLYGTEPGRFVTAVYGHATPHPDGGWSVALGSAGHPAPLLVGADGSVRPVRVKGLLAGVVPDAVYEATTVRLAPGETLLLYTDGVIEAEHDTERGQHRLMEIAGRYAAAPPDALVEAVEMDAVERIGTRRGDDIAVFAVRAPR